MGLVQFIALTYFAEKDVGILLAFLALNYMILYSMVTSTFPTQATHGFNNDITFGFVRLQRSRL